MEEAEFETEVDAEVMISITVGELAEGLVDVGIFLEMKAVSIQFKYSQRAKISNRPI